MGLLTIALLIDLLVGDPDWLWRRVSHPVALFGKIIDWADKGRFHPKVRQFSENENAISTNKTDLWLGIVLLLIFVIIAVLIGRLIDLLGGFGQLVELLVVTALVAQRSLYDHVERVRAAIKSDGLEAGKKAVSMIVGRDVSKLNESGICKAAIESLAENFSDGVVAPVFWYVIGGLPGILFYKAVNTADSMIGHHTEKYEYFGKAAAKLDDWMNWPAARISTVLIMAVVAVGQGGRAAKQVWRVTNRDAGSHRSPNAGWPESSFAAGLGLSLGGPRQYGDDQVEAEAIYYEGRSIADTADIIRALGLFLRACFVLIATITLFWLSFR